MGGNKERNRNKVGRKTTQPPEDGIDTTPTTNDDDGGSSDSITTPVPPPASPDAQSLPPLPNLGNGVLLVVGDAGGDTAGGGNLRGSGEEEMGMQEDLLLLQHHPPPQATTTTTATNVTPDTTELSEGIANHPHGCIEDKGEDLPELEASQEEDDDIPGETPLEAEEEHKMGPGEEEEEEEDLPGEAPLKKKDVSEQEVSREEKDLNRDVPHEEEDLPEQEEEAALEGEEDLPREAQEEENLPVQEETPPPPQAPPPPPVVVLPVNTSPKQGSDVPKGLKAEGEYEGADDDTAYRSVSPVSMTEDGYDFLDLTSEDHQAFGGPVNEPIMSPSDQLRFLSPHFPPGRLQAFTNDEHGDQGPKAVLHLLSSHHHLLFPTVRTIRKFITSMLWPPPVLVGNQEGLFTSDIQKRITKQFGYHLGIDNLQTRAITTLQDYYCMETYEQVKTTLQLTREDIPWPLDAPYVPPEVVVAAYYAYCQVNDLIPIPLHYRLQPFTNEDLLHLVEDGECPAEAYLYGPLDKFVLFYIRRDLPWDGQRPQGSDVVSGPNSPMEGTAGISSATEPPSQVSPTLCRMSRVPASRTFSSSAGLCRLADPNPRQTPPTSTSTSLTDTNPRQTPRTSSEQSSPLRGDCSPHQSTPTSTLSGSPSDPISYSTEALPGEGQPPDEPQDKKNISDHIVDIWNVITSRTSRSVRMMQGGYYA